MAQLTLSMKYVTVKACNSPASARGNILQEEQVGHEALRFLTRSNGARHADWSPSLVQRHHISLKHPLRWPGLFETANKAASAQRELVAPRCPDGDV
jgi:hypothetical protein